jgi:queuine tRNA-ribosyltransferase
MPTPAPVDVLGDYAVHIAREGFASIVHRSSGEIMHSRTPPMEEARRVYVEQADFAQRLRSTPIDRPLVLWDVGLGAAANVIAAIECRQALAASGPVRPLQIVSFENDLDSLRLALANADRFPYLQRSGLAELLREGRWQSSDDSGLSWELVQGEYPVTIADASAAPEVVFYDMFSPKTCGGAWTFAAFRSLFAACGGGRTTLCTYTLSTASRAAMLAAGFFVARGRSAGEKAETTVAFTPAGWLESPEPQRELLGAEWLAKWERSAAKFPADVPASEQPTFERLIREHAQFARM